MPRHDSDGPERGRPRASARLFALGLAVVGVTGTAVIVATPAHAIAASIVDSFEGDGRGRWTVEQIPGARVLIGPHGDSRTGTNAAAMYVTAGAIRPAHMSRRFVLPEFSSPAFCRGEVFLRRLDARGSITVHLSIQPDGALPQPPKFVDVNKSRWVAFPFGSFDRRAGATVSIKGDTGNLLIDDVKINCIEYPS